MYIKLFLEYCVSDQTSKANTIGSIFIILNLKYENIEIIATAKYVKIILYTYLGNKLKKLTIQIRFYL